MRVRLIALASALLYAGHVYSQSLLVCKRDPRGGATINSIWPAPYIGRTGTLCFDVKSWPEYSGQNCVTDGGRALWTGLVIVSVDGESQGRDSTKFRINNAVVKEDRLEYVIEWSRGAEWKPMQNVKINRLSGNAVSYFVTMHGGDSYQCHVERKKI